MVAWLDRETGVPVAVEQEAALQYDEQDLRPILEALGLMGDVDVTAPGDFGLALEGRTVLELTHWEDGLRMAPMAALLSPVLGLASPFAATMFMPYGLGMGGPW